MSALMSHISARSLCRKTQLKNLTAVDGDEALKEGGWEELTRLDRLCRATLGQGRDG